MYLYHLICLSSLLNLFKLKKYKLGVTKFISRARRSCYCCVTVKVKSKNLVDAYNNEI